MTTLETARTILRPLTTGDCAAVQRWASVPENVTYMPWGPNTDTDTLAYLEACEKSWTENPVRRYEFGIVLKASGELIGSCGTYLNNDLSEAELGWILRRDHWKRGIMTETAGELIRFCFEALRLHRVFATSKADNAGSWTVMERNNMRREAHYIKARRLRNVEPETWVDSYEYAILEEEYFNAK
jgi:RimJ/RimL family protein N-acetyltransferase